MHTSPACCLTIHLVCQEKPMESSCRTQVSLREQSLDDHDRMFQAEQSVLIFQMIPYMTCCKTAGSRWLLNVASMTSPISASRVVSAVSGSLSEMLLPRKKPRSWELVRHVKMVKSAWLCKTQKIPNAFRRPFLLYVKFRRKTMIPQ